MTDLAFCWSIYFDTGIDDIGQLAHALKPYRLSVTPRGPSGLEVADGMGTVIVSLDTAAHVREEAAESVARVPHPDAALIAACEKRINLHWSVSDAPEVTNLQGYIEPADKKPHAPLLGFRLVGKRRVDLDR